MKERTRQAPEKSMPQAESREAASLDAKPGQEESQEKKHVDREKALPPQERGRLSQDIQRRIGLQLRAMYTDVVNEGVPDRFAELIRRLDKHDKPDKQ
jgi:Anti-sigma factor NepR